MTSLISLICFLVKLVNVLIIIWCLLSWFPNVRWYDQPFKTLDQIVQPIIAPFRRIIPPIGNIDFSALIALVILQIIAAALEQMVGQ